MSKHTRVMTVCWSLATAFVASESLCAQQSAGVDLGASAAALRFRYIGPVGNRIASVAGVTGDANVYYAGAASGGIWKTVDAGIHWSPIFDNESISSVGALAVAPSNPNIVWAGTGEPWIRSHISIGNGLYKSTDAGRTWTHSGPDSASRTGRIVIDPANPDIVFVAAQGHSYGPEQERGVYRTTDGGQTWNKVLFVDANTGAIDVVMHPTDSKTLFAAMWQLELHTWGRESGGTGSGVYVTHDGGDHWTKLEGHGLPTHEIGKVGLAISRSNPNRVYALIETGDGNPLHGRPTDNGELWRSEDGGVNWKVISFDRDLACRQPYYTRMAVAPDNPDETYFLCATFNHSMDGGSTLTQTGRGGGGGRGRGGAAQATRGRTRRAAGAGVHVARRRQPRHLDRSDESVAHGRRQRRRRAHLDDARPHMAARATCRSRRSITPRWTTGFRTTCTATSRTVRRIAGRATAGPAARSRAASGTRCEGGESGWATPDPVDPNVIWSTASGSGSRGGIVVRFDERTRTGQNVEVWPLSTGGHSAAEVEYRFVWDAPFTISPHDHNTIYTGSQFVHMSKDGGRSWRVISPDLTRNDKSKQQSSGGLTPDNIGVEYGDVVYAIAESRAQAGRDLGGHERRTRAGDARRGQDVDERDGERPRHPAVGIRPPHRAVEVRRGLGVHHRRRAPGEQPRPVGLSRRRTSERRGS